MAAVLRRTIAAGCLGLAVPAGVAPVCVPGSPSTVGRPLLHPAFSASAVAGTPSSVLTSQAIRRVYGLPSSARGGGRTVAVVQFSGFDPSDIAAFRTQQGLPSPSLSVISVDGADPAAPGDFSGGLEATLDSDAVSLTAPDAAQNVYVAPNTTDGFVDVLNRVADDAVADPSLAVATISWAECDTAFAASDRNRLEAALARILATGVPVFAASGDVGPYGCSQFPFADLNVSAEFPASSSAVVAVGGTSLTVLPGQPPTEAAWSSPQPAGMSWPGWGSGGAESAVISRPPWQAAVAMEGNGRLVPDISAAATSVPAATVRYDGQWWQAEGTSLAAPLVAGGFAAALSATGAARPGDLHRLLYGTPAAARDITAGTNLLYPAGRGYDLATGLGVPRFDALVPLLAGDPLLTSRRYSRTRAVPVTVTVPAGRLFVSFAVGAGGTPACSAAASGRVPGNIATEADGTRNLWVAALADDGTCHVARTRVVVDTTPAAARLTVNRRAAARRGEFALTWRGSDRVSGVAAYRLTVRQGRWIVFDHVVHGRQWHVYGAPYGRYTAVLTITDRAGNRRRVTASAVVLPPA